MLMNMSRAIAAAASAIVLGTVGLQPAAAAEIQAPDYQQSPGAYQNVNPSPPGGFGSVYPRPPAVHGYPVLPPVMYRYPGPPRAYYGPRGPFIAGPYPRPRLHGPVYGSYAYRGYAYGGPVFVPRGPYWRYGPY